MTLALTGAALVRVIDPLAGNSLSAVSTVRGGRRRRELEREKQLVLKAIKEIELDYQMRKIAERDYREMVERYRTRAIRLMSEIEAGDDFRVLIERELTHAPEARRRQAGGCRCVRGGTRGGKPASISTSPALVAPAPPSTTTMPGSVRNAEKSSFKPDCAGRRSWRVASVARAQPTMMGGSGMPNLAEIVGRPLPDNGMPAGTVSVRVARRMPSNGVAGAEVSAVIKNAAATCGGAPRRPTPTDGPSSKGMAPGDEFNAEVTVDGELLKTEAFTIPQVGGLRTMLIAALDKSTASEAQATGVPAGDASTAFGLGVTAARDARRCSAGWGVGGAHLRRERRRPQPPRIAWRDRHRRDRHEPTTGD